MFLSITFFVVHIGIVNGVTTSTQSMPPTVDPPNMCDVANPCLNGGSCRIPEDWECSTDPGMGETVCDCPVGYKGARCEIKVQGTCGGSNCGIDQRCVLDVNKVFKCISESDTSITTAPHCSPGPHDLNYTLDMKDRDKHAVCLDMYYTNTNSTCYDIDSSIDFEIVKEDESDLFCLTIDYHRWQTCLGVNKTFNKDNFPTRPVMNVVLAARENDRFVRTANTTFRVTFNTAPSVTRKAKRYLFNMAEERNTIDIENDFGVTDEDVVEFSLEGTNPRLNIAADTGMLSVTLQDRDVMSANIKIKDEGIPSLTNTVEVNIEVLTLNCSQTRDKFYVNNGDIKSNSPVGKIQCQHSKGYTLTYTANSPSGLELKVANAGLVSVTSGSVGNFTVPMTITLAGKINFTISFSVIIREVRTCVFGMTNPPWISDYNDITSIRSTALRNDVTVAIEGVVSPVPNITVEILLFRPGSVVVYFLLMAETETDLEKADTLLRNASFNGRVGTLTVNNRSYQSSRKVGLVLVDSLNYSSPNISNTASSTFNNTEIQIACSGVFLLPVGEVIMEWRLTKKNALIVPLSYSRLQTQFENPYPGNYAGSLSAKNILVRDTGPVTCSLKDSAGRSESNHLDIKVIAKPIVMLTPIRHAVIRSTETITLTCNITEPRDIQTTIIWFEEEKEIKRENTTNTATLKVNGNDPQNFRYQCQGQNAAGKGNRSGSILVSVTQAETVRCEEDGVWPPSSVGIKVEALCPAGESGIQTRICGADGKWQAEDQSQCVSNAIGDVIRDIQSIADGIQVNNLSTISDNLADNTKPQNLETREVALVTDSLDVLLNISRETNITDDKEATVAFTKGFVKTAGNLLDPETADQWKELDARPTKVLTQIDSVTEVSAESLSEGQVETIQTNNIDLQIGKTNTRNREDIVFPSASRREGDITLVSYLHLKYQAFALKSDNGPVLYSSIYYKNITAQLPSEIAQENNSSDNSSSVINSDTLALNIFSNGTDDLKPPLMLNFSHTDKSLTASTRVCAYLDIESNMWKSDGCNVIDNQTTYTVCACDHLTNFAILINPFYLGPKTIALEIITIVGCSISIICLILTIIIYVTVWRYVKSDQAAILMNICVCLTIAMLLFVVGVDKTSNQTICTTIAALLHLFYLVTFFMMLAAGVEIVWTVVRVFSSRSKLRPLLIAGWLLPIVIVGISMAGTQMVGYGTKQFCWLSIEGGLIWAFVGPVLVIIIINFVILGKLVHTMLSTKFMDDQELKVKIKMGIRGMCILLPILGVSWVLGMLAFNQDTVAFQYVFAILNSLQGLFIFITQCCLSKKVRSGLANYKRRYMSQRSHLSSNQQEPGVSPRQVQLEMLQGRDPDSAAYQNLLQSTSDDPTLAAAFNPAYNVPEGHLPPVRKYDPERQSGVYDIPDDLPSQMRSFQSRPHEQPYQGLDNSKRASNKYDDFSSWTSAEGGQRGVGSGNQQGSLYVNQKGAKGRKGEEKGKDNLYRNTADIQPAGRPPLEGQSRTQPNTSPYANMASDRHRHQPVGKEDSHDYNAYEEI